MADVPATTVIDQSQVGYTTAVAVATGFQEGYSSEKARESAEKEEIKRLRSKHPDYQHLEGRWNFYLRSYEGGPDYVSEETLFKHQREHAEDFADRLKRASYANFCQPLVDFVPDFIFSQDIDRDPGSLRPQFEDFKHNVDRAGTSLNNFMKQVSQHARIFGMCYIQVDKPKLPEQYNPDELSVLEAQKLGLDVPYLVSVNPIEVLDWRTDDKGNFIYLKRVQYLSLADSMDDFSVRSVERYTEWSPTKWRISDVDVSDEDKPRVSNRDEGPNAWKVVPFIPHFHRRSKFNKDIGVSFLQDIAYQNRSVFNNTSLIDEFLYRQCFNILAMERDTTLPTANNVEGNAGTSNVLEVPRDAKHMPEYIAPPVDPAEFIQSERENSIKEMYRQAAQDIMHELFARSGDAVEKGFNRTIPVIAEQADQLQQTELHIFSLWAKMMKKEWTGKIAYRDDYSITNLLDMLVQLTTIFNGIRIMSPTFVREEWKRIVREFDGKLQPEIFEKIISEINKVSDEDIVEMLKSPKNAKTGQGTASAAQLMQGKEQKTLGTDRKRTLATGDRSATKERVADGNKRTKGSSSTN